MPMDSTDLFPVDTVQLGEGLVIDFRNGVALYRDLYVYYKPE